MPSADPAKRKATRLAWYKRRSQEPGFLEARAEASRKHYAKEGSAEKTKARNSKWRKANTAKTRESQTKYVKRNPLKIRARAWIRHQLRNGFMVREPCEKCGAERADAHHDDYSKPLEVRWLCRQHHMDYHREKRERDESI